MAVRTVCREGLSLLAADSEEELSSEEGSDVEDNRPSLLPLDEVIRVVPSSLSSLLELIVPRLQQRSGVKGVSPDDQQSFVSILVGELSSQFSDIKQQIDDPFLSPQKNKTLHRLVAVQVCRILEDLYAQYTAKAARLFEDGSLSVAAHMSRLRAQLSTQASKSINLPTIRRQVLSQLRGPLPTSRPTHLPPVPRWRPPHRTKEKTNLDSLDLGAPLSSKLSSLGLGASSSVLRRRVQKLRAGMTQNGIHDGLSTGVAAASDSEDDVHVGDDEEHSVTAESSPERLLLLQRPPSMPELYGNFLLCDWKLLNPTPYHIASPEDRRREKRHQALQIARRSSIGSSITHDIKWTSEEQKVEKKLGDYTQEDLNSDLHKLSELDPSFIHSVAQDDIDPLLQACIHGLSQKQRSRLAAHDLRVKEQEEMERRREEEERRRRRESQAVPTLEDMENMQYLRTQAPQSFSHSNASLHMRSTSSQLQYESMESAPDICIKVEHWSEGEAVTLSQADTTISDTAISGTAVSMMGSAADSPSGSGLFPKPLSQHSDLKLGSGLILDPVSQHKHLESGLILDPVSQHGSGPIPDPVSLHSRLHLGSGLIPEPISRHSSLHLGSGLISDPISQHSSQKLSSGLILEPISRHSSLHLGSGLIPDPISQHSSQKLSSGLILEPISQHSSLHLGSGLIPDPSTQHSCSMLDTHQHIKSNYPSLASKLSSSTLPTETPRPVPLRGSSRNLLTPVADSGLLGLSSGDLPIGSQLVGDVGSEGGWRGDGVSAGKTSDESFSDEKSFSQTTFSDIGSHEQGETSNGELHVEEQGPQPQPAVITTRINDKVIRSSDICVSERTPLNTLRLKPYKPIWNELSGELDSMTMDALDSNLREGREMDILYHELVRTIPKDYLDIESDPSLIPAIPEPVDLPSVLASSSLPHRPTCRIVNPDLRPISDTAAPWGDKGKKEQWKKSNLYTGPDPKELMAPKGSTLTPAQARLRQQYLTWLKWWRATVSPEDYLKFVAQKESDYLHHVYHLYDSEGSESEPEEEKERRERLVRLHSKLQAKRAKCEERYRRKNQYEQGMWNVNTVLMGGLGGDPDSAGSSGEEDIEDQLRQLEQNGKVQEEGIQQRLQAVWSRIQLSAQQSMEMAIKYSSHQYEQHTRKALTLWENICNVIEERENQLEQLQTFEKSASDPSRLFAKGQGGTSSSRVQEAKTRRQKHSALDILDRKLSRMLKRLQTKFGDVVTYKGRPYHEKMKYDRTELLYWLQQERRKTQLTPPAAVATEKTVKVVVATLNV